MLGYPVPQKQVCIPDAIKVICPRLMAHGAISIFTYVPPTKKGDPGKFLRIDDADAFLAKTSKTIAENAKKPRNSIV